MRFLLLTPARQRALARAAATAVVAVALAACSFITGVPNVSRVELTIPVLVIAPGQSVQATGLALGSGGNVITNARRQVTYSSSNDSVARVTASGLILGIAPGRATITASSDGKSASKEITVRPVPVRQVLISRGVLTIRQVPGVAYILSAAVLDTNNQPLANRPPTWKSLDPTVATINQVGAITALALGSVRISATVDTGLAPAVGTVGDTVTLRVTPTPVVAVKITPTSPTIYTGQKLTFVATVTDSLQTTVTRRVVWSSSDRGTVLAVDSLSGEATAVGSSAATTTVTAAVEIVPGFPGTGTRNDFTSVTVLPPAASVRVSTSALALRAGASAAVTFTAVDALGNSLSGRTFRLTSSAPAVVAVPDNAVPSNYTLTAGATAGTATITVQTLDVAGAAQGTSTTFTVTVSP